MPALCLCYVFHETYQLRHYTVFDIGHNSIYEDDDRNGNTLLYSARNCYLPMNDLLLKLIKKFGKDFKLAISVSCTALDQFEQYAPEVLDGLKALADTGCVEFMAETGPHTLSFLYSQDEFKAQVKDHMARTKTLFGKKPVTFRNADLVYNNDIASTLEGLGFKAVLAEGADHVLGWRSPNYMYSPVSAPKMRLLMRNKGLSMDLSRNFRNRNWDQWPLTAEKFASWCHNQNGKADIINIFNDYHIFGLRNKRETGIFEFMEALPGAILANKDFSFVTPSEAAKKIAPVDTIDVPQFMSWDAEGGDLTAWLGNDMQKDAIHALYALAPRVRKLMDKALYHDFKRLQTSEHFRYMSTKWFTHFASDRPNPYQSPYDAYITYMNVLGDFTMRLNALEAQAHKARAKRTSTAPATKSPGEGATSVAKVADKAQTQAENKSTRKARPASEKAGKSTTPKKASSRSRTKAE